MSTLPQYVQHILKVEYSIDCLPILSDYDVYMKMRRAKKPQSSVGCDIPVKIVKEFSVELSLPVSKIFNFITKSKKYPKHWKMENGIALEKITPAESETNLRIISKTPFLSKLLYKSFIYDWLIKIIEPH